MNCTFYPAWYEDVRPALAQGAWFQVPPSAPHPSSCGFGWIAIAEDHGQIADWGTPTPGGSRLHLHEHADGTLIAHEDRFDPEQGILPMLAHVLFETPGGKVAVTLAGGVLIAKVVASLLD